MAKIINLSLIFQTIYNFNHFLSLYLSKNVIRHLFIYLFITISFANTKEQE